MRVISGTARGLRLESPDGQDTRPTLDNVKEAVFSMLFDRVRDAKVLDLFAGSGALGIEALSRGASHCIFSDKSQKSVSIVRTNVTKARLTDKAEIVKADYKEVLSDCTGKDKKFDIIFLDPPYNKGFIEPALEAISVGNILAKDGIAVLESDNTDFRSEISGLEILNQKRYGRTFVTVYGKI